MREFKLQIGDIFATKGVGMTGWASRNLFAPKTDRFHHGILWKHLGQGDFIILESISKGLAVGKLSWYEGKNIEYYRVNCDEDLRFAAPGSLVEWGRAKYDYWLIVKLLFGAIAAWARILWKERRLRKLKAEDLPFYNWNDALICTEAVVVGFASCGVNIVPPDVVPLPSAIKQAELDGRLTKID